MAKTIVDQLTSDPEGMRLYQQERAILELTEMIWQLMQDLGVSKADLASRLGKSRAYVTKLLDGSANMTVRTMSDVLWALGYSLGFTAARAGVNGSQPDSPLKIVRKRGRRGTQIAAKSPKRERIG